MGRMQREKGKRGERLLSHELTRLFGRACRRGQQYCGADGSSDVVGIEGVHAESKYVERLDLLAAVAQAVDDAKDGNVPVVFHRRNSTRKQKDLLTKDRIQGDWLVTVQLDRLPDLVQKLYLAMASE